MKAMSAVAITNNPRINTQASPYRHFGKRRQRHRNALDRAMVTFRLLPHLTPATTTPPPNPH